MPITPNPPIPWSLLTNGHVRVNNHEKVDDKPGLKSKTSPSTLLCINHWVTASLRSGVLIGIKRMPDHR